MLCEELIKELSKYNPKADVTLVDSEDICLSYISKNLDGEILDKSSTKQIFIEACDICQKCTWETETYCTFYDDECSNIDECYNFSSEDNE